MKSNGYQVAFSKVKYKALKQTGVISSAATCYVAIDFVTKESFQSHRLPTNQPLKHVRIALNPIKVIIKYQSLHAITSHPVTFLEIPSDHRPQVLNSRIEIILHDLD